jgi:hypothetical protein
VPWPSDPDSESVVCCLDFGVSLVTFELANRLEPPRRGRALAARAITREGRDAD